MLEHTPQWLGEMLRPIRAGTEKLCIAQPELGGNFGPIDLCSPAFNHGERLPERFTADGEGISPPLVWGVLPRGTRSLALIVEDPDAPTPAPLVHAIVWGIHPYVHALDEGRIHADGAGHINGSDTGINRSLCLGNLCLKAVNNSFICKYIVLYNSSGLHFSSFLNISCH